MIPNPGLLQDLDDDAANAGRKRGIVADAGFQSIEARPERFEKV